MSGVVRFGWMAAGTRMLALASGLALATAARGWAQDAPPLQTDRPTQTEGAAVVPPGLFQLELGGSHVFDRAGDGPAARLTNVGGSVLRVGMIAPLELRVGTVGWQRASAEGGDATAGLGDLTVGAKARLARGAGLAPAVTVSGTMYIPVGDTAFRAGGVDPSVRVAVAHDLGRGVGLGYNVGALWSTVADPTGNETLESELFYTLALTAQVAPRVSVFGEGYGASALEGDGGTWVAADAGVIVLVLPTLQLDATGGLGISEAASDWFVGLGVTVRVPR